LGSSLWIRFTAGTVFISEGVQKFLFADGLGPGRFARIGCPVPEGLAYAVASVEVVCGLLVPLAGLLTRAAVIPLAAIMVVALVSTKLPILFGHGLWIFSQPQLPRYGFWAMAHEARTGFAMLFGTIFSLLAGAGPWSLDGWLFRRSAQPRH